MPSRGAESDGSRKIKDPIHDSIFVGHHLSVFIDTPQYQRLRSIKQLGTSYYVWPGACHNRFEHGLGVAHLARTLVTHLKVSQPELDITKRDIECVEIAALCHDLGHGPWSHVWDNMFMPHVLPNRPWKHEDGSEMMLDHLIAVNNIAMPEADVRFIKDMIAGEKRRCDSSEKQFLFDIVANKRNGLDVDRFDYFVRDSHMIGEPMKINLQRLLDSARVIDNEICYDIKDVNNIYEIYNVRFRLHKSIYSHKTAKAIEYMIIDGLKEAQKYVDIAGRAFDPVQFTSLTDEIMGQIDMLAQTDERFAVARAIFNRIKVRDLYRCVDYKIVAWADKQLFADVTAANILAEAKLDYLDSHNKKRNSDDQDDEEHQRDKVHRETYPPIDPANLSVDDIIVSWSSMHYGMADQNPILKVKFYSKRSKNKAMHVKAGDYSTLMPAVFGEYMLRVYTKKPQFFYNVQAGYRAVLQKMAKRHSDDSLVVTPPSTPRQRTSSFGRTSSFEQNEFTRVPFGFVPPTPSRDLKRRSEGNDDEGGSPRKKRA